MPLELEAQWLLDQIVNEMKKNTEMRQRLTVRYGELRQAALMLRQGVSAERVTREIGGSSGKSSKKYEVTKP
jgi:hypothetical protein